MVKTQIANRKRKAEEEVYSVSSRSDAENELEMEVVEVVRDEVRSPKSKKRKESTDSKLKSGSKEKTQKKVKSPVKTPAKSPAKTHVKAPAKSPAKTHAKALAKSPAKTPASSLAKAPAKSPAKSPLRSPQKATVKESDKKEVKKKKAEKVDKEEAENENQSTALYSFPMNRISRIIKSENSDIRMLSESVFLINKASEKFLELFTKEAYACASRGRKKTIEYKHLSSVLLKRGRFEFLSDFVPEKIKAADALKDTPSVETECAGT